MLERKKCRPTPWQLEEMDNERHFTESVGAFHSIRHHDGRLCSLYTNTHGTADTARRHSNGHHCANIHATCYIHTAPDILANRRSIPNLDAIAHAGGEWHAHPDRLD